MSSLSNNFFTGPLIDEFKQWCHAINGYDPQEAIKRKSSSQSNTYTVNNSISDTDEMSSIANKMKSLSMDAEWQQNKCFWDSLFDKEYLDKVNSAIRLYAAFKSLFLFTYSGKNKTISSCTSQQHVSLFEAFFQWNGANDLRKIVQSLQLIEQTESRRTYEFEFQILMALYFQHLKENHIVKVEKGPVTRSTPNKDIATGRIDILIINKSCDDKDDDNKENEVKKNDDNTESGNTCYVVELKSIKGGENEEDALKEAYIQATQYAVNIEKEYKLQVVGVVAMIYVGGSNGNIGRYGFKREKEGLWSIYKNGSHMATHKNFILNDQIIKRHFND